MRWVPQQLAASLSATGLLLGTLFFAASLTPSLVPRSLVTQGLLSGVALATGYGIGVLGRSLWLYVELPSPAARAQRNFARIAATVCIFVALLFLWRAAEWQNSVRTLMGVEPVDSAQPLLLGAIVVPTFAILLAVGRLFALTLGVVARRLPRFMPRRITNLVALLIAVLLFWSVINGMVLRASLRAADATFQEIDELIPAELQRPADSRRTGSAASLVSWETLGRAGREFVSSGPSGDDLRQFFGVETQAPIRVYVGLNSAESVTDRAELALKELERTGAFERTALVIVTPTGSGWVDPKALDSVEYLMRGDVASVAQAGLHC